MTLAVTAHAAVLSRFLLQRRIAPFLREVFMPVVSTVFGVLQAPLDARDLVALNEKKMLQRGYFSFLAALVSNDVSDVLRSQGTADARALWRAPLIDGMPPVKFANNSASIDLKRTNGNCALALVHKSFQVYMGVEQAFFLQFHSAVID